MILTVEAKVDSLSVVRVRRSLVSGGVVDPTAKLRGSSSSSDLVDSMAKLKGSLVSGGAVARFR
ncbi:predicted protein [Sclerotinia sclerotiorum 1980 UF-70]|uniref:Uncharacterized protein n=1 Tax=Sclerotinia sclerotiorum (strain ATCC 18683 / 1980 / Ss-1) TaxID=665079 RepID=A7F4M2_SCLS1|nr:predicted protein [Sclerotinia sclerotiorum 1980 UF-70]EDN97693.1 predicted protein [Sclerotinia sclerotiorum 1980 UF-70]